MCAGFGAWLMLTLAVITAADLDKRSDMSPMPFVMGSRYGRSSPPKLIAPRNDKFFMGSRYGKRSGPALGAAGLVCEFTGVFPLYRCLRQRERYDATEERGD